MKRINNYRLNIIALLESFYDMFGFKHSITFIENIYKRYPTKLDVYLVNRLFMNNYALFSLKLFQNTILGVRKETLANKGNVLKRIFSFAYILRKDKFF